MRDLFSSAHQFFYNIRHDIKDAINKHFALHTGEGGGVFLLVPFTRFSMWLEWRDVNVGFGHERGAGQWEFFAGRLQGVFCIEPVAGHWVP